VIKLISHNRNCSGTQLLGAGHRRTQPQQ